MTTTTTVPNVNAVQGGNPLQGLLAYGQSPVARFYPAQYFAEWRSEENDCQRWTARDDF